MQRYCRPVYDALDELVPSGIQVQADEFERENGHIMLILRACKYVSVLSPQRYPFMDGNDAKLAARKNPTKGIYDTMSEEQQIAIGMNAATGRIRDLVYDQNLRGTEFPLLTLSLNMAAKALKSVLPARFLSVPTPQNSDAAASILRSARRYIDYLTKEEACDRDDDGDDDDDGEEEDDDDEESSGLDNNGVDDDGKKHTKHDAQQRDEAKDKDHQQHKDGRRRKKSREVADRHAQDALHLQESIDRLTDHVPTQFFEPSMRVDKLTLAHAAWIYVKALEAVQLDERDFVTCSEKVTLRALVVQIPDSFITPNADTNVKAKRRVYEMANRYMEILLQDEARVARHSVFNAAALL